MATEYTCAECKAVAAVVDGVVVRSCEHKDAAIVASLTATAHWVGGVGGQAK